MYWHQGGHQGGHRGELSSVSHEDNYHTAVSDATAIFPQAMLTAASDGSQTPKAVHVGNASHNSMVRATEPCAAPSSVGELKHAGAAVPAGPADVGSLTWRNILHLNWRLCVAVFFVYAVTLSIFPGFLAGKDRSETAPITVTGHETVQVLLLLLLVLLPAAATTAHNGMSIQA
jgi:hypothetical protein